MVIYSGSVSEAADIRGARSVCQRLRKRRPVIDASRYRQKEREVPLTLHPSQREFREAFEVGILIFTLAGHAAMSPGLARILS